MTLTGFVVGVRPRAPTFYMAHVDVHHVQISSPGSQRYEHDVPFQHRLYIISVELSTLKNEKFSISHINITGYKEMGLFCYF